MQIEQVCELTLAPHAPSSCWHVFELFFGTYNLIMLANIYAMRWYYSYCYYQIYVHL